MPPKADHAKDVEKALKAGAKVDGPDEHGITAITYAIVENSFNAREVIRALLKAKASVNVRSDDGTTPLMFAEADECAALLGDKWERRRPFGGTTLSVPCDALGGALDVNVKTEGTDLAWSIFYPKPVAAYLGARRSASPCAPASALRGARS